MHLPCPHCRKTFRVDKERIRTGSAWLKCPACSGRFLVQKSLDPRAGASRGTSLLDLAPAPGSGLPAAVLTGAGLSLEAGAAGLMGAGTPEDRKNRPANALWLLLPAFGLLLAFMGILMPVARQGAEDPARQVSDMAHRQAVERAAPQVNPVNPATAGISLQDPRAPFRLDLDAARGEVTAPRISLLLGVGLVNPCQVNLILQDQGAGRHGQTELRELYPYWIAHLSSERLSRGFCPADPVFLAASEAMQHSTLCADGYAFLAAYYIQRRVPDRSQTLLEEARRLSSGGLWVRWVEFLYYLRILEDRPNAGVLLQDLVAAAPDFPLARYFLAKMQIQAEDYEKADESFSLLQRLCPRRPMFGDFRQALSSIIQSSYYSSERAAGLLSLSRSFDALGEQFAAEELLRMVLERMPGRLAVKEEKAAYFELGRLREDRGDPEGAYESYLNALKLDPLSPEARKKIEDLLARGRETS